VAWRDRNLVAFAGVLARRCHRQIRKLEARGRHRLHHRRARPYRARRRLPGHRGDVIVGTTGPNPIAVIAAGGNADTRAGLYLADTNTRNVYFAGAAQLAASAVRQRASPFIPKRKSIRGFIYDVKTGRINEVEDPR
jgi:hypothetical protein